MSVGRRDLPDQIGKWLADFVREVTEYQPNTVIGLFRYSRELLPATHRLILDAKEFCELYLGQRQRLPDEADLRPREGRFFLNHRVRNCPMQTLDVLDRNASAIRGFDYPVAVNQVDVRKATFTIVVHGH